MKLIRFVSDGQPGFGLLDGPTVYTLDGDPFGQWSRGQLVGPLLDVQLLPPCVPTKIIAVGLNYADPTKEGLPALPSEPIISFKPPSSAIGSGSPIVWPRASSRIDYEGEVAIVIGKVTRRVEPWDVAPYIFGVTCANDVTARDLQWREGQWARAKGFDTFCPLGPCIDTTVDPSGCKLVTRVNREIRQSASSSMLHFGPHQLVSYISHVMTLVPGDVILTGTPAGVSALKVGDVVEVEIEGVGVLVNHVVAEECLPASGEKSGGEGRP